MSLNCNEILSSDIYKDCSVPAMAGIEVNVTVVPLKYSKYDYSFNSNGVLTYFEPQTIGVTFRIEGIKQAQGVSFELIKKEDSFDTYKHSFSGVILTPSAENKKSLQQLNSGEPYILFVEKKWKGMNLNDAFEVLGWDAGLYMQEVNWNTKESDGIIKFVMATADGSEETNLPCNFSLGTYVQTKNWIDTKFNP